jgi:antitoxin MazE
MKIPVIKIGNSKGIRLSKTILTKYEISDEVELILEEETILLKSVTKSRKDWDQKFSEMHAEGEDRLLINDVFEDETFEEWK